MPDVGWSPASPPATTGGGGQLPVPWEFAAFPPRTEEHENVVDRDPSTHSRVPS